MGKHKFNAGRVCEYCAGNAGSLPRGENGKFNPCPEAPDEGKIYLILIIVGTSF
jgi:hypothetical protein